uniref:Uncharacterized protein n=1 Tax=Anopheles maculatus TaxID=74869 RepID=A0A182SSG4_9DIPT
MDPGIGTWNSLSRFGSGISMSDSEQSQHNMSISSNLTSSACSSASSLSQDSSCCLASCSEPDGSMCYVNPNFKKISNHKKRSNYGCRRRWFAGREPWPTLHFYSNYAGRLVLGAGYHDFFNTETYPLESIKEFEAISSAWKQHLAELLKKGSEHSDKTSFRIQDSVIVSEQKH